jgi:hypothetical protein
MNAEGNRGLVALVIVMGVIVAIGLVVVVVTIASRLINASRGDGQGQTPAGFETADIPITEGCQVMESLTEGGRLILRLGNAGRCNQLLFIDVESGKLIGRINLVPAP